MTKTELGLSLEPAHHRQEGSQTSFERYRFWEMFLPRQLVDLENGFKYKTPAREVIVPPGVAQGLVQDFLLDIKAAVTAVSIGKEESRLIHWDNPTQASSYVLEKQKDLAEHGVVVDCEGLDFVLRRCLYAVLAFGLELDRAPQTEGELAWLEENYFQEDIEVPVLVEDIYVLFACSVAPMKVGRHTLYQRRWVVKPAPVRKELRGLRFDPYFENLPLPAEYQIVFRDVGVTDPEDGVADEATVAYCNKQTGRPEIEFYVRKSLYSDSVTREIREFSCTPDGYQSLVTGEELEVEVVEVRVSQADRNWRRRAKEGCRRQVYVLREGWSPKSGQPRELGAPLENALYERVGCHRWLEGRREVFLPGKRVYYLRDEVGNMCLAGPLIRPEDEGREVDVGLDLDLLPQDLGKAREMIF